MNGGDALSEAERDIALVLVTGAGASRSFGMQQPFPLMKDWPSSLIRKIVNAQSQNTIAMRTMLPVTEQMDGPLFEQTLGTFLRQVQAFDAIRPLLKPSLDVIQVEQALKRQSLSSGQSALGDR